MKTILRGFMLKEYLSFRTLILKMIGLTLSLGSGLPLGKEGPFVHVASALASQLSRFMTSFEGVYVNESRSQAMLAAGCAVGVACTFSTPIGGVLFSIEVTSTYFAVRNYWMGFFAALCAASTFRIVRFVLNASSETVEAYYQTRFPEDAFYLEELPLFGLIGLVCGLAGALFIKVHRSLLTNLNRSSFVKKFLEKNWLLYPVLVSFMTSSITYPEGFGQFLSGQFALSILSSTLPIPAGIFMPVFIIGASFGRLVGELVAILFPNGIHSYRKLGVYPGIYAVVGAASFCGSVTHTISVAVIVFEVTGQLMHILPVMVCFLTSIAVFVGNIVCAYFQPSIYESIIIIKKLPYIREMSTCLDVLNATTAEQIMVSDVKFIWKGITYSELKKLMDDNREIRSFPIVLDKESRVLLGSVNRKVLNDSVQCLIGDRIRRLGWFSLAVKE
ncbi:unnamed protein product [Angiostrongylus costaricensis]|uniref:Chloride channel protein n=1 Tax=Angiostrongylus costaricensis TaxID=334426 RepID=A0A0R3PKY5_ANGCS|nr:unnamed protein product [Angiostrongylus costaricensis]